MRRAMSGPGSVAELRERVEADCRPLRDAVERLQPADFDRRTRPGWTVKEMLAHLAFWEETAAPLVAGFRGHPEMELEAWYHGDLQAYAGDVGSDWPPAMVHNARETAWARPQEPREVVARWDQAHRRLLELVESLSQDELRDERIVAELLACCSDHYQEHLSELAAPV
ncbi:MAG: maleylpyruvate isomerase N-terminal domain-containing protein [Candidatus Dormibacteraeota bacterium]|nr:maleylpyruvate isomerase N-terminal domain-containing protein [Candidatus Dormibacteraeota bacterium]